MTTSSTPIDTARRCFSQGDGARGKEIAEQEALRRLNHWHIAQVRRGEMVHCGEGWWKPRSLPQMERLRQILNGELFRDASGAELAPDVAPVNWEHILTELAAL